VGPLVKYPLRQKVPPYSSIGKLMIFQYTFLRMCWSVSSEICVIRTVNTYEQYMLLVLIMLLLKIFENTLIYLL